MNDDPSISPVDPDDSGALEQFLRDAAPHHLPADLRARILAGMEEEPASSRIIRFPRRLAAAAAVFILGGLAGLMVPRPSGQGKVVSVPVPPVPVMNAAFLTPVASEIRGIGSESVGPVVDVDGQAVRVLEAREVATRTYEDPSTGALVAISFPQTRYQYIEAPIQ